MLIFRQMHKSSCGVSLGECLLHRGHQEAGSWNIPATFLIGLAGCPLAVSDRGEVWTTGLSLFSPVGKLATAWTIPRNTRNLVSLFGCICHFPFDQTWSSPKLCVIGAVVTGHDSESQLSGSVWTVIAMGARRCTVKVIAPRNGASLALISQPEADKWDCCKTRSKQSKDKTWKTIHLPLLLPPTKAGELEWRQSIDKDEHERRGVEKEGERQRSDRTAGALVCSQASNTTWKKKLSAGTVVTEMDL